jgi:hypothetical protein
MGQEVLRVFRFALDPAPAQVEALLRHAGAARWVFNHALGMKAPGVVVRCHAHIRSDARVTAAW